jgi:hypothetical protein
VGVEEASTLDAFTIAAFSMVGKEVRSHRLGITGESKYGSKVK